MTDYVSLLQLAAVLSGQEPTTELPKMRFVETCKLASQFFREPVRCKTYATLGHKGMNVMAYYDPDRNTMYLRKDGDPNKAFYAGVVVHEFVHYLQDVNGIDFRKVTLCQLESQAYHAQNNFYKLVKFDFTITTDWITKAGLCGTGYKLGDKK